MTWGLISGVQSKNFSVWFSGTTIADSVPAVTDTEVGFQLWQIQKRMNEQFDVMKSLALIKLGSYLIFLSWQLMGSSSAGTGNFIVMNVDNLCRDRQSSCFKRNRLHITTDLTGLKCQWSKLSGQQILHPNTLFMMQLPSCPTLILQKWLKAEYCVLVDSSDV